MKATLHIEGPYETRSETVENEVSIGRTSSATVAVEDPGLSRVNTTFFVDNGELWVVDEGSTNGTFLNGERLTGKARALRNGDELKLGSSTTVRVELRKAADIYSEPANPPAVLEEPDERHVFVPPPAGAKDERPGNNLDQNQKLMIGGAAVMTIVILLFGGIAYYVVSQGGPSATGKPTAPQITASAVIPRRVIDPLGGENEEDLDDLIASWEVAEDEIVASDVADISSASGAAEEAELNVSASFLAERQRLALEDRPGEKGIRPAGLKVPKELYGDGVVKQKAKLREMNSAGYQQPMDFADLAMKRMSRELLEMPMATESFYLDVGGSAQDRPFSSFSFKDGTAEIVPGHPKYDVLKRLADDFAGQQYDLSLPEHRKQIRRRLLRMFQPRARPILKELADAYFQRFRRPLRVTSLTRSMDYQILLNSGNANSFKVRGEGSLPPHTSGCAFDLARKHMPVEEQNFVMAKLAEMELANKLDALIEYGVNACFHIFIYHDGVPPPQYALQIESRTDQTFPFLAKQTIFPR